MDDYVGKPGPASSWVLRLSGVANTAEVARKADPRVGPAMSESWAEWAVALPGPCQGPSPRDRPEQPGTRITGHGGSTGDTSTSGPPDTEGRWEEERTRKEGSPLASKPGVAEQPFEG